jgi:hypothetical protein
VSTIRSLARLQAVVRTLMKTGMEPTARDASGKTALDIALARAGGNKDEPLVAYMQRTARLQTVQRQGREARRTESRGQR